MTDLWALERLFRDAWPALEEREHDGWLTRLTGGDTRRPNAVNPLHAGAGDVIAALDVFRRAYAEAGLRQMVRVPDFCKEADARLEAAGLRIEGTTRTISRPITAGPAADPAVELTASPNADWLAARTGPLGDPATEALLSRIALPAVFGIVREAGEVAAIGYVVVAEGYGVIESIRTMPAFQRRGLGNRCVAALIAAAGDCGAHTAALQVDAANTAGLALYRGLGFDQHLYDYHYRVPG